MKVNDNISVAWIFTPTTIWLNFLVYFAFGGGIESEREREWEKKKAKK